MKKKRDLKNKAKTYGLTPRGKGKCIDNKNHVYPLVGLEDVCMKCFKVRGTNKYAK